MLVLRRSSKPFLLWVCLALFFSGCAAAPKASTKPSPRVDSATEAARRAELEQQRRQEVERKRAEATRKQAEAEAKRWAEDAQRKLKAQQEQEALQAKRRAQAEQKAEQARLEAERKAQLTRQQAEAKRRQEEGAARRKAEAERLEAARKAELARERLAAEERKREAARQAETARLAKLQAKLARKQNQEAERLERQLEKAWRAEQAARAKAERKVEQGLIETEQAEPQPEAPPQPKGPIGKWLGWMEGMWPGSAIPAREVAREAYRLRVGDEVEISISGYQELAFSAEVLPSGNLSFPLVGLVQARGRTLEEVTEEVQERLRQQQQIRGEGGPNVGDLFGKTVSVAEALGDVYRLRPGDQLNISVWGYDKLDVTTTVLEDGSLLFPLLGYVEVDGKTLREAEGEIQQILNEGYIVEPRVNLKLVGAEFSILGEVEKPGPYPVEGSVDLLTALSQGAQVNIFSGPGRVEIIRMREAGRQLIVADVDKILKGIEPNLRILPRDFLYVRRRLFEELKIKGRMLGARFYIYGEVGNPGSYVMGEQTNLLTAITSAGGITKFGSAELVIVRPRGERKVRIHANVERILSGRDPNIDIFPHDILYVRRRLF